MYDFFISHKTDADGTAASQICAYLEGRGYKCWIAPRNIDNPTNWAASITNGIRESRMFLLLLSGSSNTSNHVFREVSQAADVQELEMLTVCLEDVSAVDKGLDYYIHPVQKIYAMSKEITDTGEAIAMYYEKTRSMTEYAFSESVMPEFNLKNCSDVSSNDAVSQARDVIYSEKSHTGDIIKARFILEQEASEGNAEALYELGKCSYYAKGCEKNAKEAYTYFLRASTAGNAEARYLAALMLESGDGVDRDNQTAAAFLMSAANDGCVNAMVKLLDMLLYGRGIKKNADLAMELAKKATDAGSTKAMIFLGRAYYAGKIVEKSFVKTCYYFTMAHERGDAEATYLLGILYSEGSGVPKDEAMSFAMYKSAADKGYVIAIRQAAFCYWSGTGVNEDKSAAFELFKTGAERNDVHCTQMLGKCYYFGIGTPVDNKKAFVFLSKAYCELSSDDPQLICIMGECYLHGKGVKKDKQKGIELITLSAEKGYVDAMRMLANGYRNGTFKKDARLALEWFKCAAKCNDPICEYMLFSIYTLGSMGEEENEDIAYYWLYRSASHGYKMAKAMLGNSSFEDLPIDMLIELCELGCKEAQFKAAKKLMFGYGCDVDYDTAFRWAEAAASQNVSEVYFYLGQFYELALGSVKKDLKKAKMYYEKAYSFNMSDDAKKLLDRCNKQLGETK